MAFHAILRQILKYCDMLFFLLKLSACAIFNVFFTTPDINTIVVDTVNQRISKCRVSINIVVVSTIVMITKITIVVSTIIMITIVMIIMITKKLPDRQAAKA